MSNGSEKATSWDAMLARMQDFDKLGADLFLDPITGDTLSLDQQRETVSTFMTELVRAIADEMARRAMVDLAAELERGK